MALTRRLARLSLSLAALLALAMPLAGRAQDRVGSAEISLGNPNAAVVLVEYASVTCPHCARFNADVYPLLKARYIDTGKVRYVFREVPINPQEDAAGFLIARCAGPERYLAVTDALFHAQPLLFEKHDLHGWLMAGAAAGGLDDAQMRACISDVAAIQAFNERADHTMTVDKVSSTPTVVINGQRITAKGPEFAFSDIDAALRPFFGGRTGGSARRAARAPVH